MRARIYQPTKTAMQSGQARTHSWLLEYYQTGLFVEPLMGWTGVRGTEGQIRLRFPTKEAAIAYAKKHGIAYDLEPPHKRRHQTKSYADNFAFDRPEESNTGRPASPPRAGGPAGGLAGKAGLSGAEPGPWPDGERFGRKRYRARPPDRTAFASFVRLCQCRLRRGSTAP